MTKYSIISPGPFHNPLLLGRTPFLNRQGKTKGVLCPLDGEKDTRPARRPIFLMLTRLAQTQTGAPPNCYTLFDGSETSG